MYSYNCSFENQIQKTVVLRFCIFFYTSLKILFSNYKIITLITFDYRPITHNTKQNTVPQNYMIRHKLFVFYNKLNCICQ